MNNSIQISLTEDEWSLLNAAADSIQATPSELARISLMQRCIVMSEDNEVCDRTRGLLGHAFDLN